MRQWSLWAKMNVEEKSIKVDSAKSLKGPNSANFECWIIASTYWNKIPCLPKKSGKILMHIFFCDFFRDTLPLLVMAPYLIGCVALMFAAELSNSNFHCFFLYNEFEHLWEMGIFMGLYLQLSRAAMVPAGGACLESASLWNAALLNWWEISSAFLIFNGCKLSSGLGCGFCSSSPNLLKNWCEL